MPAKNVSAHSPLTFDLPVELYDNLVAMQKKMGEKSVSGVIRAVVESFDFSRVKSEKSEHRQISVRISPEKRALLARVARQKKVSAGALIRVAIAHYKPVAKRK